MSTEKQPIRFGLSAREAAGRWEAESGTIVSGHGSDRVDLQKIDDSTWTWRMGDVETGRIEFRDAGVDQGEASIELSRSDDSASERIRAIVEGLSGVLSAPGLDSPVVARDPQQGEPPEASTEPDQPL